MFIRHALAALGLAATLAATQAFAAAPQETPAGDVSAVWQPVEIHYAYHGFTTAYNCDALRDRLASILKTLGAHPKTRVSVSGCPDIDRPARNLLVRIETAMPVAASAAKTESPDNAGAILKHLGVDHGQTFTASWQEINLAKERHLNLQPGDCDLMEGLGRSVLPKLPVKVVQNDVTCTPNQLGINTPTLTVEALVPQAAVAKN